MRAVTKVVVNGATVPLHIMAVILLFYQDLSYSQTNCSFTIFCSYIPSLNWRGRQNDDRFIYYKNKLFSVKHISRIVVPLFVVIFVTSSSLTAFPCSSLCIKNGHVFPSNVLHLIPECLWSYF